MKRSVFLLAFLSLMLNVLAQDYIKPIQGAPIYAKVIGTNNQNVIYSTQGTDQQKIDLSNVEFMELQESGIYYVNAQKDKWLKANDYTGNLIEEGRSVYVPYHSTCEEEQIAARRLRDLLSKDGFWKCVDTPMEAHFILRYYYDEEYQHAYLILTDMGGQVIYQSGIATLKEGGSPREIGLETADNLYVNAVNYIRQHTEQIYKDYDRIKYRKWKKSMKGKI